MEQAAEGPKIKWFDRVNLIVMFSGAALGIVHLQFRCIDCPATFVGINPFFVFPIVLFPAGIILGRWVEESLALPLLLVGGMFVGDAVYTIITALTIGLPDMLALGMFLTIAADAVAAYVGIGIGYWWRGKVIPQE